MSDWIGIVLVVVLVLINGFFVAAEFSLVSVRKTRIAERIAQGDTNAKAVQRAIENPDRFIAATQLGITLASLGLGWIGEPALSRLIEPLLAWLPGEIAGTAAHIAAASIIAFVLIRYARNQGIDAVDGAAANGTHRVPVARPTLWAEYVFRPLSGC
jgi:CBS domain containing-hemolysin-like protein